MTEIDATFDQECTARKITLSRETRGLCLAVIKAVLTELNAMPTPVDGFPTIKGRTLTPEEVKKIEDAIREQRGVSSLAPIVERVMPEDVRDYHKSYNPTRDL